MSEGPGEFAERLRRFRERAALTQEELAERAGVTAKAISALERGERRRPYPHTVRALADALKLDDADRDALSAAARPSAAVAAEGPAVPLIGRERDREELVRLLGEHRLVTLTGPGGVGKTTLAVAVAGAGATVVELAPVAEARLVVPTLARALGVRQSGAALLDAVVAQLGSREHLVVLDNLEHVLDAAGDVAELLTKAPRLTVLATSRAPLRIRAEREYPLAPLPVPGSSHPDDVARSPAVQVFLDRARAAGREVALHGNAAELAQICRRLDGLPLALELAAAHARFLDPAALLQRLDQAVQSPRSRDLPERQRTMRATLDWSHDLLTSAEQLLLRRLSVFAGGFPLDAAEHLQPGAFAALGGLVEQSLVVAEDGRYRMLEPVRQYAAARLAEAGETAVVADRAADFFVDLAADVRPGLETAEQRASLDRLAAEHGNLAATFAHLIAARRHGDAALLAADTWMYWALRGNGLEGLGWVTRIPEDGLDDEECAARAVALAVLRYATGDIPGIVAPAATAAEAARAAGDDARLAEALELRASAALFLGDPQAAALAEEARQVARETGNPWIEAHTAQVEGRRLLRLGDLDGAAAALADAERLARKAGAPFTIATALNARATLARARGEDDVALELLLEVVDLAAAVRTTWNLAYALPDLGALAAERGQAELAAELFGAGAAAAAVTVAVPPDPELAGRWLNTARDEVGEEAFGRAWERGRHVLPADVPALAARISRGPSRRTSGTSGRTRS
ncbi:ATP-binding protein [Petropleomorpha daqingensis]|uniref:Putative ATPase/DNA-binding XRE family transcriptional regulator n=1 Tax=Petropleomorpha daqingensis TaxID=2026353 RepID=A0A853C7U9_9ACTN|nr:putative ATPase/DNA-binding XRE family transcriptional regulator [Petropleomorpha daqingensis]